MARRTLTEMNQNTTRKERFGMILERRFAVGKLGYKGTGTKVHLLETEVVIDSADSTRWSNGEVISANSFCNGRGQQNSSKREELDTDRVTCQKCLKIIGG